MAELYFVPHRVRAARTKKEGCFYVVLVRARGADPTKKKCNLFWVIFFWEGFPLRKYPFSYDLASVDFDCIVKLELLVDS